ncbi:MAG: hypothetical protein FD129_3083, partial [bacterium]
MTCQVHAHSANPAIVKDYHFHSFEDAMLQHAFKEWAVICRAL